jgi:hypothetical protein
MVPEAAVKSASSAHISAAEKPIKVARSFKAAPQGYPSKRVAFMVSVPNRVGTEK